MNEREFQHLLETARVRALTPAEQSSVRAWTATHPEAKALWAEERQLDDVLRRLPDVQVSTNFTAQVLAAARQETVHAASPRSSLSWLWRGLVWPRVAFAAGLVALVSIGVWQLRLQHRAQLAASVEVLSGVAAVPTIEMLTDFDAIARLNQLPANPDAGILTALQSP